MTVFDKLDLVGNIGFVIWLAFNLIINGSISYITTWVLLIFLLAENLQKHYFKRKVKTN